MKRNKMFDDVIKATIKMVKDQTGETVTKEDVLAENDDFVSVGHLEREYKFLKQQGYIK